VNIPPPADPDTLKRVLPAWIAETFQASEWQTVRTSYDYRKEFEEVTGLSVTDTEFKICLIECGIHPVDASAKNWFCRAIYLPGLRWREKPESV
jgi:hypothetical protein